MSQILYLQDYNAKPSLIYLKHQIGTVENSQPDQNILTVTVYTTVVVQNP
jgi:hypothetical protein